MVYGPVSDVFDAILGSGPSYVSNARGREWRKGPLYRFLMLWKGRRGTWLHLGCILCYSGEEMVQGSVMSVSNVRGGTVWHLGLSYF